MKAIVLREFGGPERLLLEEMPVPSPGPGEVQVRVHAVSVNRTLDLQVRQDGGWYNVTLPMVLGIDPAGVVTGLGDGVTEYAVGQRVSCIIPVQRSGGNAEYATVAVSGTYAIPDGVSCAEATVVTRHFPQAMGIARTAEVKPDDWVLVMGAAGALGSCAVQVAKDLGARVIAAAGAEARIQAACNLGADHGINYRTEDLAQRVLDITGGHGADAVFENIADPTIWPGAFGSLARGGRLVTVGAHGGGTVSLDVAQLYHKQLKLMSGLRSSRPGDVEHALQQVAAGRWRVLIDRTMPLSQAAEAHRLVASNTPLGKVMLDPTAG